MSYNESKMNFIFDSKDCFLIEKCQTYQAINNENVKIADFVVLFKGSLLIIEAKSSSPNPNNKNDFNKYISEIYEKLLNSILLFFGIKIKRPYSTASILPISLKKLNLDVKVKLLLIINGHRDDWLSPLNDRLNIEFISVL